MTGSLVDGSELQDPVRVEGARSDRGGLCSRPLRWAHEHPYLAVFVVALGVRVALILAIQLLRGGAVFDDESTYAGMASDMARGHSAGWDDYTRWLYSSTATFTWPLTAVYWLTGGSSLTAHLMVASFGAGAAAGTAAVADVVASRRAAVVAGLIVALFPSQVLWSSLTLKDACVWLVVVLIGNAALRGMAVEGRAKQAALFALLLGLLLGLGHLREHTLVIASCALLLAALVMPRTAPLVWRVAIVAAAVAGPWIMGLGPVGITLVRDHGSLETRREDNAFGDTAFVPGNRLKTESQRRAELQRTLDSLDSAASVDSVDVPLVISVLGKAQDSVSELPPTFRPDLPVRLRRSLGALSGQPGRAEVREALRAIRDTQAALVAAQEAAQAAAKAGKPPAKIPSSIEAAFGGASSSEARAASDLKHLPVGLRVFVLDPLPWQRTSNSRVLVAKAESVIWYPVLVLALVGAVAARGRWRMFVYAASIGGATMVSYALVEGNFGTAYRHRGELVWVAALFAGVGVDALMERKARPAPAATKRTIITEPDQAVTSPT